jgi:hypothetical protein
VSLARTELDPAALLMVRIAALSAVVGAPRVLSAAQKITDAPGMTIAVMEAAMADPDAEKLINCKGRTVGRAVRPFPKRAIAFLPGWRDSAGYVRRAVPADRAHGGRGGPVRSSTSWPSSSTAGRLARS